MFGRVDQLGMIAALASLRTRVQIPSRPLLRIGLHWVSPVVGFVLYRLNYRSIIITFADLVYVCIFNFCAIGGPLYLVSNVAWTSQRIIAPSTVGSTTGKKHVRFIAFLGFSSRWVLKSITVERVKSVR